MLVEDRASLLENKASVEAAPNERDPSRLRIDIRVHPVGGGSVGADASEIQRAIRGGVREALREAQLERLMLAANPQPKRRGWLGRVLAFLGCAALGAVAVLALSAYHPRPAALASLEELGSPVATPGSQSSPGPAGSEAPPPQNAPGPATFGLHQQ